LERDNTGDIYEKAGLTNQLGFGATPALLVIDMQIGFTSPERSVLAGDFEKEIPVINRLIASARRQGVPVIFTGIEFASDKQTDGGLWVEKIPTLRQLTRGSDLVKIDPRLTIQPSDMMVVKQYASAFFATPLASTLTARGIDTLLVTGCTTSGCVRATVVDAISHGFRPIIVREAVGDRAAGPHHANLLDMDSKYGDVLSLDEVMAYLDKCQH